MRSTVIFVALIATLLAACGDDDSDGNVVEPVGVSDALTTEGEVVVTGYLFELDGGTVVLAEAIAESFPPQPGGASVTVTGLDLGTLDLEEAPDGSELATTRWTAEQITLTGSIVAGVLNDAELQ
jgi:hypothetical protein